MIVKAKRRVWSNTILPVNIVGWRRSTWRHDAMQSDQWHFVQKRKKLDYRCLDAEPIYKFERYALVLFFCFFFYSSSFKALQPHHHTPAPQVPIGGSRIAELSFERAQASLSAAGRLSKPSSLPPLFQLVPCSRLLLLIFQPQLATVQCLVALGPTHIGRSFNSSF